MDDACIAVSHIANKRIKTAFPLKLRRRNLTLNGHVNHLKKAVPLADRISNLSMAVMCSAWWSAPCQILVDAHLIFFRKGSHIFWGRTIATTM